MILNLPYPLYLFSLIPLPLHPSSIDPLPSFPSSLFPHFSPSLLYLILVPDFALSISFILPLSLSTHISLSLHSSSLRKYFSPLATSRIPQQWTLSTLPSPMIFIHHPASLISLSLYLFPLLSPFLLYSVPSSLYPYFSTVLLSLSPYPCLLSFPSSLPHLWSSL
jgi:hypothetical protein